MYILAKSTNGTDGRTDGRADGGCIYICMYEWIYVLRRWHKVRYQDSASRSQTESEEETITSSPRLSKHTEFEEC